jgi:F0F1-type ATP synthase alpha subunit
VLDFGKKLMILFNQDLTRLVPRTSQFILFGLLFSGFWKGVPQRTMESEIEIILDNLEAEKIISKEELNSKIDQMDDAEDLKDFCQDLAPRLEKLV